jgi:hypothetical protein
VFESQFNRLTSVVYSVGGTWDDPEVEFDRIFDDTGVPGTGSIRTEPGPAEPTPPVQSESP